MPIRWSALKVSEAMDMAEEFINQAIEPLEQVRIVAQEARKIDNLPHYIEQGLNRLIGEIDRAIGGSSFEPIGRLKRSIEGVRKDLPSGAIEADQAKLKHGSQQSLI